MLGEQVEAVAPAAGMSVARLHRVEAGLLQRDFGLAGQIPELHRHDGLGAGLAVLAVPRMRHDNALVFDDLKIDATEPKLLAVGAAHAAAKPAAGARIALGVRDRKGARRAPLAQVLVARPGLPHEADWRIEYPRDDKRA